MDIQEMPSFISDAANASRTSDTRTSTTNSAFFMFVRHYMRHLNCLSDSWESFVPDVVLPSQWRFYDALSRLTSEQLLRHAVAVHDAIHQHIPLAESLVSPNAEPLALSFPSDGAPAAAGHHVLRHQDQLSKTVDDIGMKVVNDYVIVKEIGRGATGKVKLAYNTAEDKLMALKIIPRRRNPLAETGGSSSIREVSLLKRLDHPRIVRLYEVIDDPSSAKVYLAMQYVDGGHLGQHRMHLLSPRASSVAANREIPTTRYAPVDPPTLLRYARDVLKALVHLHRHGIVHRDVKPENILISSSGDAFLSDLGVAQNFYSADSESVYGHVGTPLFMCPYLLEHNHSSNGCAVDMWALGVTLLAALTGDLPFQSTEEIRQCEESLPIPQQFGPGWSRLLRRLLRYQPKQRWSATRALRHVQSLCANEGEGPGATECHLKERKEGLNEETGHQDQLADPSYDGAMLPPPGVEESDLQACVDDAGSFAGSTAPKSTDSAAQSFISDGEIHNDGRSDPRRISSNTELEGNSVDALHRSTSSGRRSSNSVSVNQAPPSPAMRCAAQPEEAPLCSTTGAQLRLRR